jgi:hypothetical protein
MADQDVIAEVNAAVQDTSSCMDIAACWERAREENKVLSQRIRDLEAERDRAQAKRPDDVKQVEIKDLEEKPAEIEPRPHATQAHATKRDKSPDGKNQQPPQEANHQLPELGTAQLLAEEVARWCGGAAWDEERRRAADQIRELSKQLEAQALSGDELRARLQTLQESADRAAKEAAAERARAEKEVVKVAELTQRNAELKAQVAELSCRTSVSRRDTAAGVPAVILDAGRAAVQQRLPVGPQSPTLDEERPTRPQTERAELAIMKRELELVWDEKRELAKKVPDPQGSSKWDLLRSWLMASADEAASGRARSVPLAALAAYPVAAEHPTHVPQGSRGVTPQGSPQGSRGGSPLRREATTPWSPPSGPIRAGITFARGADFRHHGIDSSSTHTDSILGGSPVRPLCSRKTLDPGEFLKPQLPDAKPMSPRGQRGLHVTTETPPWLIRSRDIKGGRKWNLMAEAPISAVARFHGRNGRVGGRSPRDQPRDMEIGALRRLRSTDDHLNW